MKEQIKNNHIKIPYYGISSIGISILFSIIILIYLGAAVSTERKNNRENFETIGNSTEDIWWENGGLFMCPLH